MKGIQLGELYAPIPILQGGMGVGVSLHNLAGAVSKAGGIGVLSAAQIGYQEADFDQNPKEANLRAIGKEIQLARAIAGKNKILAANIMVAMTDYAALTKEFVKQGIDLIISGAGLPMDLPSFIKGSKTKIAPIVSSLRCCQLIVKTWRKKYDYLPDLIVVEGPKAGGHLGFKETELVPEIKQSLEDIVSDIVSYTKDLAKETGKQIPVIAAGGIWDGADIHKFLSLGASGVQMATRFVATEECDASQAYKEAYVTAKTEDIRIIHSPVGMPGRAIFNEFLAKVEAEKFPIRKCYHCIRTCHIVDAPYCITKALIEAVRGNLKEGLIFCGSNVDRIQEITTVPLLMKELLTEYESALLSPAS